jgi:hypothetical protein
MWNIIKNVFIRFYVMICFYFAFISRSGIAELWVNLVFNILHKFQAVLETFYNIISNRSWFQFFHILTSTTCSLPFWLSQSLNVDWSSDVNFHIMYLFSFCISSFLRGGTGVWTQGFNPAKQVLCFFKSHLQSIFL